MSQNLSDTQSSDALEIVMFADLNKHLEKCNDQSRTNTAKIDPPFLIDVEG